MTTINVIQQVHSQTNRNLGQKIAYILLGLLEAVAKSVGVSALHDLYKMYQHYLTRSRQAKIRAIVYYQGRPMIRDGETLRSLTAAEWEHTFGEPPLRHHVSPSDPR